MGFEDWMDMDLDTLRQNYKKLVVVFHPDKLINKNQSEKSWNLWNKIQDSFNTLSDERKRQIYDATLKFDDSIPENYDSSKDEFFETFSRFFKINSYWSKIKPVPLLGSFEDSN